MNLSELKALISNGFFSQFSYDEGTKEVTLMFGNEPKRVNETEAKEICTKIGWEKMYLKPFKILEKTQKFMKQVIPNTKDASVWDDDVQITFRNFPAGGSDDYGKSADLIMFDFRGGAHYRILYGDKKAGGAYVVYKGQRSIHMTKERTVKRALEAITADIISDRPRML